MNVLIVERVVNTLDAVEKYYEEWDSNESVKGLRRVKRLKKDASVLGAITGSFELPLQLIRLEGATFTLALSYTEAKELLQNETFDFAIVDLVLPADSRFSNSQKEKGELKAFAETHDVKRLTQKGKEGSSITERFWERHDPSGHDYGGEYAAAFGVLVARELKEHGIPFTIFTEDFAHTHSTLPLAYAAGIVSFDDIVEVANEYLEERDNGRMKPVDPDAIVVSKSKNFTVGSKRRQENWDTLFRELDLK